MPDSCNVSKLLKLGILGIGYTLFVISNLGFKFHINVVFGSYVLGQLFCKLFGYIMRSCTILFLKWNSEYLDKNHEPNLLHWGRKWVSIGATFVPLISHSLRSRVINLLNNDFRWFYKLNI